MLTISRSKTIFLKLNKIGRNYLPFIKELETYDVKYIDILPSAINFDQNNVITTIDNYVYLSLEDKFGNLFYDTINVRNFNPNYYLGQRKFIGKKLVLQNCFVEVPEYIDNTPELLGKVIAITFYWDEPRFTAPDNNKKCYKETVELLLQPSLNRERAVKIKFPDIRTIAGKRIRSIRPAYMFTSISPLGYNTIMNGWNIADGTSAMSIYLTLANGANILIDMLDMNALSDNYQLESLNFENILINFPDSYIEVVVKYGQNQNLPTDVRSIPLIIEYMED